ncbi:hypothetical protein CVT26_008678 [Gymnopilus dilepis]|uniref:DNA topoisomerase 2 n=1 Tax=Gymnopilus dilepis TaxID=231916 RepID=A0A409XY11_9AGAR|nr:hypothetical protein CVT26_008678 [Gymnopilus dilepis]
MSSSDGEDFDFDVSGSESDDYAPVTKKAPSKPKSATKEKPKAATTTKAKAKPAPKKKVLAEHDDNVAESAMEIDDDAPRDEEPDASSSKQQATKKKKTATETYTKLTQLEHILKRPDSYIGSVETITQAMWTYDAETKRMVHREVKYVPGFFKIVDEILVNAADNKINDPSMDTLKVNIDVEENTISVYNNGRGIPIEIHEREKIYVPELIFGHLLSSSNYDDDEKKLTGGRNGYGAKLANIYSHEFTVETADKNTQQKYKQTWTDNMGKCGKPKITKSSKSEEYTRITFRPDLKRFGMDRIDEDTASLLRKRVYDMAGVVKDVKVYLNDERLKIKNFKQYVEMYINSAQAEAAENSGGAAQPKQTIIHEVIGPRWEVAFAVSDGSFQQVSFANAISTIKGGTHVTHITDQIAKNLVTAISKKNKGAAVKPAQIKNHMWIFVNAMIENPTFDSQTKETLTLPASKFGRCIANLVTVMKSSIVDNVLNWAKYKADQQIKKTDGSKRERLLGLTKLADANNAGTRHAKDCTLILTEGDSAKALAVAGLGVVGRDNFGVFPLRGKLLNVREAKHDQIMKNEEIQNIKKIMGLQHNKDYSNTSSLRYGRLMIMTDQDHDGSHIKGLLINFLDHFYPSLLKLPEFLVEFVTPIVRVTKGKQRRDFFTIPEYEQWLEETPDAKKWTSKYFKGLGTSSDADARDYFSHMAKHMIPFAPTQEGDRELIDLAFSKKKADERKEWLRQFKPGTYLDHRMDEIPYSEFINKELILFSMADNIRSIPSVADGLKPGQRKVIWACFKRKLKSEIKVAQLVGYISEHAAYHHGEASLAATIINLAQDYVGSNNMNMLRPSGQFGTRDSGGKDHAAPRYIFTQPMPLARVVYNPADDNLLNPQKDDNLLIEPEFYMPIVPLVLINGAEGIGTGWSTSIPCYNPTDIVANIRRLMNGEEMVPMNPWWRGFKGEIRPVAKHKYDVFGVIKKLNDTTVEITELPIHKWTQTYKAELEAMIAGDKEKEKDGVIKDYKEHHDNMNVHFIVSMSAKDLEKAEAQGLLEFFKLTSKINTSNMICFDFEGKIKKYDSPEEILEDFYPVRLAYYQKRKDFMANELQLAFEKLTNQARFVQMIVDKQLVVSNRKKADIVSDLRKHKFRPFPKGKDKASGETEPAAEEEEEEESEESDTDYDYLLGMAIWSLTKEKIERLKAQAAEKEAELLELLEKSPKDLWNTDLDMFLQEWEKDCLEFEEKKVKDANGKKVKRKQTTLKTRKSLGTRDDSDDDDDFKPIKAPAKRKPAEPKKPAATAKGKEKAKEEEDEDVVVPKREDPPKRRAAAAAKQKKLDEYFNEDSSEDELAAPPPKAKQPVKKVEESDSDIVVVEKPVAKGKAAAKGKSAESERPPSKRKAAVVLSSESESEDKQKRQSYLADPALLVLDIRPHAAYSSSRLPRAISLSVPSTLLKRPLFSLSRISAMLPSPAARARFDAWPSASAILVYDADSSTLPESSNIAGLLRKFKSDGFKGELLWLKGGFQAVARDYPQLLDHLPPSPDAEPDEEEEQPAKSAVLQPRHLPMAAFDLSSTTIHNTSHFTSSVKQQPQLTAHVASAYTHPAFNPFFDTVRQNTELSHGITERIPLRLPRRVRRRINELPFPWLQDIARRAAKAPHRPKNLTDTTSSSESEVDSDDSVNQADVEQGKEALAMQFYKIELSEQRRLMGIMEHHSRESGHVSEHSSRPHTSIPFPYSITAGVEKGAKNRYRHIWPFEHARVRLHQKKDADDDYINASYIQPLGTTRRYIATQGPLPATFTDFWTLCWEQNVHVIVMLTREVEGAMVKCGSYWTDTVFGPLRLRLISKEGYSPQEERASTAGFFDQSAVLSASAMRSPRKHYPRSAGSQLRSRHYYHKQSETIKRVFELTHTGYPEAKPRKIIHFQYLEWPDLNVPDDPRGVLGLVKQVEEAVNETRGDDQPSDPKKRKRGAGAVSLNDIDEKTGIAKHALGKNSPVLLHCSAGVGRTGGFIAVDAVLDAIRRELRSRRAGRTPNGDAMDVDMQKGSHPSFSTVPLTMTSGVEGSKATHSEQVQSNNSGLVVHVPVATPMSVDQQEESPNSDHSSSAYPSKTMRWAENVRDETGVRGAHANSNSPESSNEDACSKSSSVSGPESSSSMGTSSTDTRLFTHAGDRYNSSSSMGTSVSAASSSSNSKTDFPSSSRESSMVAELRQAVLQSQQSAMEQRLRTMSAPSTNVRSSFSRGRAPKLEGASNLFGPAAMPSFKLQTGGGARTDESHGVKPSTLYFDFSDASPFRVNPPHRVNGLQSECSEVPAVSHSASVEDGSNQPPRMPANWVPPTMDKTQLGPLTGKSFDYKEPRPLHEDFTPPPLTTFEDPIWEVVQDMREQRMSLCQSLRQYVFVHAAIIEGALMVLDEEKEIAEGLRAPRTVYPSTDADRQQSVSNTPSIQLHPPSGHPYPPNNSHDASTLPSASASASTVSLGKRGGSPMEFSKEDHNKDDDVLLSKRPSIKRKQRSGDDLIEDGRYHPLPARMPPSGVQSHSHGVGANINLGASPVVVVPP